MKGKKTSILILLGVLGVVGVLVLAGIGIAFWGYNNSFQADYARFSTAVLDKNSTKFEEYADTESIVRNNYDRVKDLFDIDEEVTQEDIDQGKEDLVRSVNEGDFIDLSSDKLKRNTSEVYSDVTVEREGNKRIIRDVEVSIETDEDEEKIKGDLIFEEKSGTWKLVDFVFDYESLEAEDSSENSTDSSNNNLSSDEQSHNTTSETESDSEEEETTVTNVGLNDKADLFGGQLGISSFNVVDSLTTEGFLGEPKQAQKSNPSNKFVVIEIIIENNGTKPIESNMFGKSSLKTVSGKTFSQWDNNEDYLFASYKEDKLPAGTQDLRSSSSVNPGAKGIGKFIYEIPAGETAETFTYVYYDIDKSFEDYSIVFKLN